MPRRWSYDAQKVLQIDGSTDKLRCVGYAPSQGRKCHNPINKQNRYRAFELLDKLGRKNPSSEKAQDILEELAFISLCVRRHRDQAENVVDKWLGLLEVVKPLRVPVQLPTPDASPVQTHQTADVFTVPSAMEMSSAPLRRSRQTSVAPVRLDSVKLEATPPAVTCTPQVAHSRPRASARTPEPILPSKSKSSSKKESTIVVEREVEPPRPTTPTSPVPPARPLDEVEGFEEAQDFDEADDHVEVEDLDETLVENTIDGRYIPSPPRTPPRRRELEDPVTANGTYESPGELLTLESPRSNDDVGYISDNESATAGNEDEQDDTLVFEEEERIEPGEADDGAENTLFTDIPLSDDIPESHDPFVGSTEILDGHNAAGSTTQSLTEQRAETSQDDNSGHAANPVFNESTAQTENPGHADVQPSVRYAVMTYSPRLSRLCLQRHATRQQLPSSCVVCEQQLNSSDDMLWCKASCGRNYHRQCWRQHEQAFRHRASATCLHCGKIWSEPCEHDSALPLAKEPVAEVATPSAEAITIEGDTEADESSRLMCCFVSWHRLRSSWLGRFL